MAGVAVALPRHSIAPGAEARYSKGMIYCYDALWVYPAFRHGEMSGGVETVLCREIDQIHSFRGLKGGLKDIA